MGIKSGMKSSKSLESWIWGAACSIRGSQDAPKFKDFILPLIFVKRLCDVFDDEVTRIANEVGSRAKAFELIERDKKLVRYYLPLIPENPDDTIWSVIRDLSEGIGEQITTHLNNIGKENPLLNGIIDRVDFNATTHGQRDLSDDLLSNLIEKISEKRLGLNDVEPDIIGRSYEYLIRKFAEGGGQSAGEFYTPKEIGNLIAKLLDPEPGFEVYDPTCGSGGLLIKCQNELVNRMEKEERQKFTPLKLYGQEFTADTWAMANMNMIIHDMEGEIELGDTFNEPKFHSNGVLKQFDIIAANPMWNQKDFAEENYDSDEFDRFPKSAGFPGKKSADWGWMQHILASLKENGRACVVLDTGAVSRGSGKSNKDKEHAIRKYFIENDFIECVILLPENLFYNTPNAGIIIVLNRLKRKSEQVMMIDVSEEYIRGRAKNTFTKKGEDLVLQAFKGWDEIVEVSSIAGKELISHEYNDYNLLPNRYIKRLIPENWEGTISHDFNNVRKDFSRRLSQNYLALYFKKLKQELNCHSILQIPEKHPDWKMVNISKILDQSHATFLDKQEGEDAPVLSLTKNDGLIAQSDRFGHSVAIEDLSKYLLVRKGWIVANPMVIWEGAIHALHELGAGVVSPAYHVWKPNSTNIDLRYLDFILKTPHVINEYRRLSAGGVKRRRSVSPLDFTRISIPIPTGDTAVELWGAMNNLDSNFEEVVEKLILETIEGE